MSNIIDSYAGLVKTSAFERSLQKGLTMLLKREDAFKNLPIPLVKIFTGSPDATAWYDVEGDIYINALNQLSLSALEAEQDDSKMDIRSYAVSTIYGLALHELGHHMFTDMRSMQEIDALNIRKYPFCSIKTAFDYADLIDDIEDRASNDPIFKSGFNQYWGNMINILEDGFIEAELLLKFPSLYGKGLQYIRKIHLDEMDTIATYQNYITEGKTSNLRAIMMLLLQYAKFGILKREDESELDAQIAQFIIGYLEKVNEAMDEWNSNLRNQLYFDFVMEFAPLFIEEYDDMKEKSNNGEAAPQSSSDAIEGLTGGDDREKGNNSSARNGSKKLIKSSQDNQQSRESLTSKPQSISEGEGEEDDALNSQKNASSKSNDENESDDSSSGSSGLDDEKLAENDKETTQSGGESSNSETGEGNESESKHDPDENQERMGEISGHDSPLTDFPESVELDLSKTLEVLAKAHAKELEKNQESESGRKQNHQIKSNMSVNDIHKGITLNIKDVDAISGREDEYKVLYEQIEQSLKSSVRYLKRILGEKNQHTKHGLYYGQRLDRSGFSRLGKAYYSSTVVPKKANDLAVGILIDESGSMGGSRIHIARITAILLFEICTTLNIPFTVFGHHTGPHSQVVMKNYLEFDEKGKSSKERLVAITSESASNRDGLAIQFMMEKLQKREEENRLLFLISDGQPADDGYYGDVAFDDIKSIINNKKYKVDLVAAAIGEDKGVIKEIYGERYLDVSSLNELPKKLSKILKNKITR